MKITPINNIKKHLIVVVDDDKQILNIIEQLLTSNENDIIKVETLKKAEKLYFEENLDSSLLLLDYNFPEANSLEFAEKVRRAHQGLPIILFTGADPYGVKLESLESGVNFFIQKPFKGKEFKAIVDNLLALSDTYKSLEDANTVISALSRAIETRDTYTEGHTSRVAQYGLMLYDEIGFDDIHEKKAILVGCLLHDIGKIGVPDTILKSSNRLTPEEYEIVKKHPETGYNICKDIKNLENSLMIIRNHHEKLDGTGYPDGLKGDEIPDIVQIVTIADIFDALTSRRAYRDEHGKEKAFEVLREEYKAGHTNKFFTELFIQMMERMDLLEIEDTSGN